MGARVSGTGGPARREEEEWSMDPTDSEVRLMSPTEPTDWSPLASSDFLLVSLPIERFCCNPFASTASVSVFSSTA